MVGGPEPGLENLWVRLLILRRTHNIYAHTSNVFCSGNFKISVTFFPFMLDDDENTDTASRTPEPKLARIEVNNFLALALQGGVLCKKKKQMVRAMRTLSRVP